VTLGLSATGAVVGAVLGALALAAALLATDAWMHVDGVGAPLAVGSIFGGLLGSVLAPIAAWTLMRHVPLWRAIVETALGTAIGVAVGYLFGPDAPVYELLFGVVGFTVAAIRLRLTHRGTARSVSGGPEAL
jgi:hypothetical protein